MTDFEDFDIMAYLEDRDIFIQTEGKNTTPGWIEIECPFCGQDPSQHFGINLASNWGKCWVCGEKAPPNKLIRELDSCSWTTAEEIIEEFSQDILSKPEPAPKVHRKNKKIIWPRDLASSCPPVHWKYLKGRNFDPIFNTEKYNLKFTRTTSEWKWNWRIIILGTD